MNTLVMKQQAVSTARGLRAAPLRSRLAVAAVARPSHARKAEASEASTSSPAAALLSAIAMTALSPAAALAAGGEYGSFLEGRIVAFIHPAVMIGLFGATCYAGYLGWNIRRTRDLADEIKDLKKQLPAPAADGTMVASPVSEQISLKESERKALIGGNFRDKHAFWGSLLLAAGTGIAIEGCVNTYMRTGKLFPGPHLYAGATIVGLWAMAAALVPAMQKGDMNARNAHIALNSLNVALFLWQLPTGFEIIGKVFEFVPNWL